MDKFALERTKDNLNFHWYYSQRAPTMLYEAYCKTYVQAYAKFIIYDMNGWRKAYDGKTWRLTSYL